MQGVKICCASSALKNAHCREMRKANGNRAEPWAKLFLTQDSDKGLSTQHLRPNLQPIYQSGSQRQRKTGSLWPLASQRNGKGRASLRSVLIASRGFSFRCDARDLFNVQQGRHCAQAERLLHSVDCYRGHDKGRYTCRAETNPSSYTTDQD